MIDIKQNGKVVEIAAANVVGVEFAAPEAYGPLSPELVAQGAPERGQMRGMVIHLADGSIIALSLMNQIKAPEVHRNPNLDMKSMVKRLGDAPLQDSRQ